MTYFLVEFDRSGPPPARVTTFEEAAPALRALKDREADRKPEVEVVLLLADSLDDLKRTHSRYFLTIDEEIAQLRRDLRVPA